MALDWEIFDGEPEPDCYCKCGEIFSSHAKAIYDSGSGKRRLVSRKSCPDCGRSNAIRRVEDPEIGSAR